MSKPNEKVFQILDKKMREISAKFNGSSSCDRVDKKTKRNFI